MHDELTQGDIDKMEKEIGYRSTVKRNELLESPGRSEREFRVFDGKA